MIDSLTCIQTQYIGSVSEETKLILNLKEDTELYNVPDQGGSTGFPFRILQQNQKVKELTIWGEQRWEYHLDLRYCVSKIQKIRVKFFDDTEVEKGSINESENTNKWQIDFGENELITQTFISADKEKEYVRTLELKTTNQKFIAGCFSQGYTDTTEGCLVGVYGKYNDYSGITRLGIVLARINVKEYQLLDVKYNLNEVKSLGDTVINLKEENIENYSDAELNPTVNFSVTHTETKSWSHKIGGKVGVKTQVTAGFPFLAEGKVEVSAAVSYEYLWGGQVTDTKTDSWGVGVKVMPHTQVKVTALVTESKIDVPYEAKFVVIYENGAKETKEVKGSFIGVNLSRFVVKATNIGAIQKEEGVEGK